MGQERFSVAEDEDLIELVANREVLWNLSHKDFRNVVTKDIMWTEIGNVMNKSKSQCKQRWKSIRDHYKKQTKPGIAKSTSGQKRASYWTRLDFLETAEDEKATFSNTSDSSSPKHSESFKSPSTRYSETSKSPFLKHSQSSMKRSSQLSQEKGERNNVVQEMLKARKYLDKISEPDHQQEDETDLFFKTVSATVKKFNPDLANEAKIKIFGLVMEFEKINRMVDPSPHIQNNCASSSICSYYSQTASGKISPEDQNPVEEDILGDSH